LAVADNEPFHVCEACRERIDPDDPAIVRAVELQYSAVLDDEAVEPIEVLGVFFHADHFPTNSTKYRRK